MSKTYDWYQCDEEMYDSNASPEEQAQSSAAREQYAAEQIAAMRKAVAEVPSYCERYQRQAELLGIEQDDFDPNGLERDPLPPALSFDF